MQQYKKFRTQRKPLKENSIYSIHRVYDQSNCEFFAKNFKENKLIELQIFEATQYNQAILSDLYDQQYPQHFLEILYTYSTPDGFIFVTDPYEINLDTYLQMKIISEAQAMEILQQVTKAIYSLYMSGFWNRNIRPEHFVLSNGIWKIQSLVYNQQHEKAKGFKSEYIWDSAYQPPELYDKKVQLDSQTIDNLIVWNLGSLLLDLLVGHHKLKDLSTINKYKGKEFSFVNIGVKRKFSSNIEKLLGKMLSYDYSKRMNVIELFSSEEICPQIAFKFNRYNQRSQKIYVPGNSKLVIQLSQRQQKNQSRLQHPQSHILNGEGQRYSFQAKDDDTKSFLKFPGQQKTFIQPQKNLDVKSNINSLSNCRLPTKSIIKSHQIQAIKSNLSEKALIDIQPALQRYKAEYQKCILLNIAKNKINPVLTLKDEKQTFLLNQFAITIVSLIYLHKIAQSMDQNINYFNLQDNLWSQFKTSIQFKELKSTINNSRKEIKDQFSSVREKLLLLKRQERHLLQKQAIQDFIHTNYKTVGFVKIKDVYREILKCTYDNASCQYKKQKSIQIARAGLYITYCMTIDKLYNPDQFSDNFKHYFEWKGIPARNYISNEQLQLYLDNADKKLLVLNSIYILKKYFF